MTRKETIQGLEMLKALMLFDPINMETISPDTLNGIDKIAYDNCKRAIEILKSQDEKGKPMDDKYTKILSDYSNCIKIPSCEDCEAWKFIEGSGTRWCEFIRKRDEEIREKIEKVLNA